MRVTAPVVLVLAEGRSVQARNQARGRLFESFVGRLLGKYGFTEPRTTTLNVREDGIELDVVARHRLTRQEAIVECKAYSASVPADMLSSFYGDVAMRRLSDPDTFGWFVAIPALSPDGMALAKTIAAGDEKFRLTVADDIVEFLTEQAELAEPRDEDVLLSDLATVITEHGVFSAAKEIDEQSRLPLSVRVWGKGIVPDPVVRLVQESDYAGGLAASPFQPGTAPARKELSVQLAAEPTIVEVTGSSADFEYQLPASPRFFVGRREILGRIERLLLGNAAHRILVLNAQSGWGKSSLALRVRQLVARIGGSALVVDSRTAAAPEYVWAVLRQGALRAQTHGVLKLPEDAVFGSLTSSLATLERAAWSTPDRPLVLFFDQFESVFRDPRLTEEFRNLALAVAEMKIPLCIGFAWKTDIISWTEGHPYKLRDDIRSAAEVVAVDPFGPSDIQTLLGRLQRALGEPLGKELRQRLREYSQGLPWLFKKLASHILREVAAGVTQDELVSESLNVQRLFEADLAELSPQENEALRAVARVAPVAVSEVVEMAPPAIVQSLVDRRLIVQVGERIDTYWDIFRDFLNTGRVPIQETYILRYTPPSVGRLLKVVIEGGGDISVNEAAARLNTSPTFVFNLSRELRQLGIVISAPLRVKLADEVAQADDVEAVVRERVSAALRRHRAYSMLAEMLDEQGGRVSISTFADALPEAFPAVSAKSSTWSTYARAVVRWFEYARLVSVQRDVVRAEVAPQSPLVLLTTGTTRARTPKVFPTGHPNGALEVLRYMQGKTTSLPGMTNQRLRRAIRDLRTLGLVEVTESGNVGFPETYVETDHLDDPLLLRERLSEVPGGRERGPRTDSREGIRCRVDRGQPRLGWEELPRLGEGCRDRHRFS
jgi:hypothetical protein